MTIEKNSSGIKVKDAAKIDAALESMKCTGNTTMVSEAQIEDRRLFEYEIKFEKAIGIDD